jgi:hypothetical protein
MKIPYSLLNAQDSQQLRNYLFTFGYLIIGDFFSDEEIILHNQIWSEKFTELTRKNTDNTQTYLSVPNYIEKSRSPFMTMDQGERFISLVDNLIGTDAIYFGSSAAEMSVPTPWHRDVFIRTPIFKFASYISNQVTTESGGDLTIVPGSQHAGDVYSDAISSAVHWPEHFGIYKTPAQYPMLKAADGSTTLDDYPKENPMIAPFPYVQLKVSARDLVIFDQRIAHGSTFYTNGKPRRMLLTIFSANPRRFSKNSKMVINGYKPADAMLELNRLVVNQINAGDSKTFYEDLEPRPELIKLLKPKLEEFKETSRSSNSKISMRGSLDLEKEFNRRNMTERDVPVYF